MIQTKNNGRDKLGRFVNGRKSERKGKPYYAGEKR